MTGDDPVEGREPDAPPSREPTSAERAVKPPLVSPRARGAAIALAIVALLGVAARAAVRALGASSSSVRVAGGRASIGDDAFLEEAPEHDATLAPFRIDATLVSAAAYRRCVDAGECAPWARAPGCDNDVGVRAVVCVDWARAHAYCRAQKKRLPTELEWEVAVKGDRALGAPSAEWTSSDFCPYVALACQPTRKVTRGGPGKRVTQRTPRAPEAWDPSVGFRCARDD